MGTVNERLHETKYVARRLMALADQPYPHWVDLRVKEGILSEWAASGADMESITRLLIQTMNKEWGQANDNHNR